MATPIFNLPTLATNSAERVTINTTMSLTDCLMSAVDAFLLNAPPVSPSNGYKAIIGTAPTGAWLGFASHIAVYLDGWYFYPPTNKYGVQKSKSASLTWYEFNAGVWTAVTAGGGGGGGGSTGDMLKSTYDTNISGVVDAAESISGVAASGNSKYYGTNSAGTAGFFPLPAGGGGGASHVIYDETSALAAQPNLAFVGAGVTATNDGPGTRTVVMIPGGGVGSETFSAGTLQTSSSGGSVTLSALTDRIGFWEPANINIYRGTTPTFTVSTGTVFSGASLPFIDITAPTGTNYYRVVFAGQSGETLATPVVSATVAASGPLAGFFTAFWKLNESSGNVVDSINAISLAPVNGPTYSPSGGVVSGCVNFTGSGNSSLGQPAFTAPPASPLLQMGADTPLFLSAWVKLDPSAPSQYFCSKYNNDGAAILDREFILLYESGAFQILAYDTSGATTYYNVSIPTTIASSSTWYHVAAWFDPTANTLNLRVNNGTTASVATSASFSIRNTAAQFRLGCPYIDYIYGLKGSLDMVGFAKQVPTVAQLNAIYNSGAGFEPA